MYSGSVCLAHSGPSGGHNAGMPRERVRVVLERSGGVVGRTVRRALDTDELPDDDATGLRALVDDALPALRRVEPGPAGPPGGADRLAYTLEIERPGAPSLRHSFREPVPDDVKALVDLMRRAPLLPARRGEP